MQVFQTVRQWIIRLCTCVYSTLLFFVSKITFIILILYTLRLLLLTASKFSYFVIFCIFRVLILAILDQYTMILMIFIVIDDAMFYSRGQILTINTNSLKLVPVYNSSLKVLTNFVIFQ